MKLLLSTLLIFLCLGSGVHAAPAPLRVVASFSILADMAKNIGGDDVIVTALVGPDSDAHSYQPTTEDAKSLTKADLIIINDLGFEGWMQRLIEASGAKGTVVVASANIKPRLMTEDGKQVTDPHAWQDLSNGRIYAKNIAATLERAAPDRAATIRLRAAHYDAELAKMDKYVRDQLAAFPLAQRKIITSHDAFGYFGEAYGLTFLAPSGISSASEASASGVAKLIQQIKANNIKRVFIENMSNPKLIKQIGKDTGATIGGTLYSDALSAPQGPAPTYLAMFQNNVSKFREAMLTMRPGM